MSNFSKLLICTVLCIPALAQVPDTPQPQKVTFFTFRSKWQAPPLRTAKQTLNKKFVILHSALLVTFLIDHHLTHAARENYPSELPAITAVTSLDYLASRLFSESLSVEAPIWGIQHYARDAAK
jgi:hypothetical protein